MTAESIRQAYSQLRTQTSLRQLDAAQQLGISEGALLAAHREVENPAASLRVQSLGTDWYGMVDALMDWGAVLALTRQNGAVHEATTAYALVPGESGRMASDGIDIQLLYAHWAHGFAVSEARQNGPLYSLQFFDASGTAIHKIFLRDLDKHAAFSAFCVRFASADPYGKLGWLTPKPMAATTPIDSLSQSELNHAWCSARNIQEFAKIGPERGVPYRAILPLLEPDYAMSVSVPIIEAFLQGLAQNHEIISITVTNTGVVQRFTGTIARVVRYKNWVNVLDPDFNLHIDEEQVSEVWVTKKPTQHGLFTCLEIFDNRGGVMASLCGGPQTRGQQVYGRATLLDNMAREYSLCLM